MSKLNQYQFHTVAPGYESKGIAKGTKKEARMRQNETAGKVIATHPDDGIVGALTYSHHEWHNPGEGRGVDVVMVDPRHRGPELREGGKAAGAGGVAGAMYNIASHEMGYKLGHSRSLSNSGAKFAERVGGPTRTGQPPRANLGARIGIGPGDLNTDLLNSDLSDRAVEVDPVVGRALTPTKPKQSRPRKSVQMELPGEDWSKY